MLLRRSKLNSPGDAGCAAPDESEALVAGGIWRSESLPGDAVVRSRREGHGYDILQCRRSPVHVFRRWRRAEDVDQRAPVYCARRELGVSGVDAALSSAGIRHGNELSPRRAFQHGSQLGGADGRRGLLRCGGPLSGWWSGRISGWRIRGTGPIRTTTTCS